MEHNKYVAFFKNIAMWHRDLAHERDGRKAFFRMNGEAEMQETITGRGATYPALLLPLYHGSLSGDGSYIQDIMTGGFEIRATVTEALDFAAIEAVRDQCKKIAMQIVMKMLDMQNDGCALLENLDVNSIKYDFTGPINVNEYGCKVGFMISDQVADYDNEDFPFEN